MNTRLAGLTAVAALLGGYVAIEGLGLFQTASTVEAPAATAAPGSSANLKLNPLEDLDPESFTAIVEQPLFNPTRQPRPAEAVAPPPPPEQPVAEQPPPPPPPQGPGPDDYKLLGVSSGPDGRIAALRIGSSGDVVYLRKGESVDSWSVVDVGDRSVAIGSPDNPVTFNLFTNADSDMPDGSQPAAAGGGQAQPLPLPLPLPLPVPQPKSPPGQPPMPEQHTIPNTGG